LPKKNSPTNILVTFLAHKLSTLHALFINSKCEKLSTLCLLFINGKYENLSTSKVNTI
jgi:hypothetical protein